MIKPSVPKGTRDFGPTDVHRRNYIFSIIKEVFEIYGYQPIETPVMENLQTLTGKYGEEGDKLLFKILNNGDYLSKADPQALTDKDSNRLTPSISKRGLRYDLTVPFARYVVMHQNEVVFPFKRYQIQPVWRADRPQKGRYQEFYQCDADVVGSSSLTYEAELIRMIDTVFQKLGIRTKIRINSRKILEGIAEQAGCLNQMVALTVAIDKIDKIGSGQVGEILRKLGLASHQIDKIFSILDMRSLDALADAFKESSQGQQGIQEMRTILGFVDADDLSNELVLDPTLARGLDYYTGCIFEVQALDFEIGSILGGGRYDNLTEYFGLKGTSGVGISFGMARIFDVMESLELFPDSLQQPLQVLFIAMDTACQKVAFGLLQQLREAGIAADLYPEPVKMKKQMKYANAMHVPYVVVVGSQEVAKSSYTLRDMATGAQESLSVGDIIEATRAKK